jgi:sensor c-di-GMP phosphodiesterase-like protein
VRFHQRYRFRRIWLSACAVLIGLAAGYFVGRVSILHSVNARLNEYSAQILQHDEELAYEVTETLRQANQTNFLHCSDADLELLRKLTFAARFLKDITRIERDRYLCSATTGKVSGTLPSIQPDITLPDGYRIYRRYPLRVSAGDFAEVVSAGSTEVAVGPDIFAEFPQEPIRYFVGVVDPAHLNAQGLLAPGAFSPTPSSQAAGGAQTVQLAGVMGVSSVQASVLGAGKPLRIEDALLNARCSARFPLCAVTQMPMRDIWHSNRALMAGYIGTGGIAGASCAVALLFAGRKKRNHSSQLKRAILMGKLSMAYQPIVELGTHKIVGAEALARWTDEDGDTIKPETIIALAEAEGFVSEITRFAITRSLEELREVFDSRPNFHLHINLAPSDLADPRLLLLLDEKLHHSTIQPANLTFELTERATSDKELAVAAIRRLRQRGHAVFIDEFGTGYSNLAYLTELAVDGIKINRSFIATLGTDSVTSSIVPQILAVAKAFNLTVVVQGIEREEQAVYFATDDPKMLGQGWFFGQAIPARSLMYLCAEKSE